ncbi:MAG: hypothetical protein WCE75_07420 [Terracidiphilus sp.]
MKSDLLFEVGYHYNFDRDLFVNRRVKKAFSLEFVDDSSEEEIRQSLEEATDGHSWRFYFHHQPSESARRALEADLELESREAA